MHSQRRAFFTLIEIVIAMALLLMIVGVVGVNVLRLVQQQRFQNDVNKMTETLSRAQQLMLIYNQNVRVKLSVTKEGIHCNIETDCKLSPVWEKWMLHHAVVIRNIHAIEFKDLNFTESESGEKQIRFFPKGGLISRGILGMSSAKSMDVEGAFKAYICLPGYPSEIYSTMEVPELCSESPDPTIGSITKFEVIERIVNNE